MTSEEPRLEGAFALDAVTDAERDTHERAMDADRQLRDDTDSLRAAAAELSKISAVEPPAALRGDVMAAIKKVRALPPLPNDGADADTAGHAGDTSGDAVSSTSSEITAESTDRATGAGEETTEAGSRSAESETTDEPDNVVPLAPRRSRTAWIAAAVAAAAAVVAIFVMVNRPAAEPNLTAAEAVISAADASSYSKPIDDWSATLYVSPSENKAVIVSAKMPDAPDGKDFQVWVIGRDGAVSSAGLMPRTGGSGQEYVVDGGIADAAAIAVTVEPAGGSQSPTSTPVVEVKI